MWGSSLALRQDAQVMCRMCERGVDVRMLPQHSHLCTLAQRCEPKGLSVDARLLCHASVLATLAQHLHHHLEQHQQQQQGREMVCGAAEEQGREERAWPSGERELQSSVDPDVTKGRRDTRRPQSGPTALSHCSPLQPSPGAEGQVPKQTAGDGELMAEEDEAASCAGATGGPGSTWQHETVEQKEKGKQEQEAEGGQKRASPWVKGCRPHLAPLLSLSQPSTACASPGSGAMSPLSSTSPLGAMPSPPLMASASLTDSTSASPPPIFGRSSTSAAGAVLEALAPYAQQHAEHSLSAATLDVIRRMEELVDIAQCAADVRVEAGSPAHPAMELLQADLVDVDALLRDSPRVFLPVHVFGIPIHRLILEKLQRLVAEEEQQERDAHMQADAMEVDGQAETRGVWPESPTSHEQPRACRSGQAGARAEGEGEHGAMGVGMSRRVEQLLMSEEADAAPIGRTSSGLPLRSAARGMSRTGSAGSRMRSSSSVSAALEARGASGTSWLGAGGGEGARTSIEDFEILKPISRGAYGRVFLVRKWTTGDIFAIKVLRKADMLRKNAVDGVVTERNILASVRSPFVVRCFYSFTSRDNLYLVMEYLDGGDLYSLLQAVGCLDEPTARFYVAELVLALEHLHSLGVVHRDIKPDNLLISHEGHVKLTDFGLSTMGLIKSTAHLTCHMDPLSSDLCALGLPSPLPLPAVADPAAVFPSLCQPSHSDSAQVPGSAGPGAGAGATCGLQGDKETVGGAAFRRLKLTLPGDRTSSNTSDHALGDIDDPEPQDSGPSKDDYGSPAVGTPRDGPAKKGAVGTPDYLAPELLLGTSTHGPAVDWWAVGVVLFELLTGAPPFSASTPEMIFENILNRAITWPPEARGSNENEDEDEVRLSPAARDLIERLLNEDQHCRLGTRGAHEVKAHPFFQGVNWDTLMHDEPPFVPATEGPQDTSYFVHRRGPSPAPAPATPASTSTSGSGATSPLGPSFPYASDALGAVAEAGRPFSPGSSSRFPDWGSEEPSVPQPHPQALPGSGSAGLGLPGSLTSSGSESSMCCSDDDECSWSMPRAGNPGSQSDETPPTCYPFANFSFKNLSQLAAINYDLVGRESPP